MKLSDYLANEPSRSVKHWWFCCDAGCVCLRFDRRTGELTIRLTAVTI